MPRKKRSVVDPDKYVRIASTADVSSERERELLDRLAKLEAEKDALEGRALVNEQTIAALQAAQKQGAAYGSVATEWPTGNKIKIRVFDKYKITSYKEDGRPNLRPQFKSEEVETYFYKIDMAPCGDTCLSINGEKYFHGAVYEFDIHTLRTVKDLCWRTWAHDRSIHPGDENFYRRGYDWQSRNTRAIQQGVF